jgi:hypothetical protein
MPASRIIHRAPFAAGRATVRVVLNYINAMVARNAPANASVPSANQYDKGREDAARGSFCPPSVPNRRDQELDRTAAQDYARGYWAEFERQRFARGDYDLL